MLWDGVGDGPQARCQQNRSHGCGRIWTMESNGWSSCEPSIGELGGQCPNLPHSHIDTCLFLSWTEAKASPAALGPVGASAALQAHVLEALSPGTEKGPYCPVHFKS